MSAVVGVLRAGITVLAFTSAVSSLVLVLGGDLEWWRRLVILLGAGFFWAMTTWAGTRLGAPEHDAGAER